VYPLLIRLRPYLDSRVPEFSIPVDHAGWGRAQPSDPPPRPSSPDSGPGPFGKGLDLYPYDDAFRPHYKDIADRSKQLRESAAVPEAFPLPKETSFSKIRAAKAALSGREEDTGTSEFSDVMELAIEVLSDRTLEPWLKDLVTQGAETPYDEGLAALINVFPGEGISGAVQSAVADFVNKACERGAASALGSQIAAKAKAIVASFALRDLGVRLDQVVRAARQKQDDLTKFIADWKAGLSSYLDGLLHTRSSQLRTILSTELNGAIKLLGREHCEPVLDEIVSRWRVEGDPVSREEAARQLVFDVRNQLRNTDERIEALALANLEQKLIGTNRLLSRLEQSARQDEAKSASGKARQWARRFLDQTDSALIRDAESIKGLLQAWDSKMGSDAINIFVGRKTDWDTSFFELLANNVEYAVAWTYVVTHSPHFEDLVNVAKEERRKKILTLIEQSGADFKKAYSNEDYSELSKEQLLNIVSRALALPEDIIRQVALNSGATVQRSEAIASAVEKARRGRYAEEIVQVFLVNRRTGIKKKIAEFTVFVYY
jgi:hypothetical protein